MSGNLGPQASTKGETTSKANSKTGYDRLDINKLYKGKTTEPVAKTVTQKHGMQTLGKAPPARRAGASIVKPEPTPTNDTNNSAVPLQQQQQQPPTNLGQPVSQNQKWTNPTSHSPGPPSLSAPNVPPSGPPEKNWNGPDVGGNYQSQRFAQEFPSLDAGSEPPRGSVANTTQPPPLTSGVQNASKSQDNQYGPGPILRPQTEGSWTQGGGRGRPPGPPTLNAPIREPGPERPNLGGPTPPPMSLGQGGPAPPPLGYPMQFRGMPPFMYPNSGPPGPGYYPPSAQGMPRYGMPVPPGAPPPREHSDSHRESNRGRGHPPPMRPTQQFAVKPILREEDLKRMDDIDQEGTWASVRDDVDYNKKINFSDEEDDKRDSSRKSAERKSDDDGRQNRDKKPVRILDRQPSTSDRDQRENRYENAKDQGKSDIDNEEEWNKRRNTSQYESKDRGMRRGRDSREEDWRVNPRFEEDPRNKKPAPPRIDTRGPPEFPAKQFSNLPPRLLRQQQQQNNSSQPFSGNLRKTPSPVSTSTSGKDRDREFQRDREWDREKQQPSTQYRILERNRGDSESSGNSIREKRGSNEHESRSVDKEAMRSASDVLREKDKETDYLKEKMDNADRSDSKREDKGSTRMKTGFMSSWADQVDDEDNIKIYDDYEKSLQLASNKHDMVKEERSVPKRVYIQQRKVENMTTVKVELPPEPKQVAEPVKEKPSEKIRAPTTVWGEREDREKSRNDVDKGSSEEKNDVRERNADGSQREIILSDKAKQLIHSRDDGKDKKPYESETSPRDYQQHENKDRRERIDSDKGRERYGSNQDSDARQDRGWARERPRPGRWGSNDYRQENRTPERDVNVSSGRSSATDNSGKSTSGKMPMEDRGSALEKSRSSDMVKETEKEENEGLRRSREDLKQREYEKTGNGEKRNRNAQDDDSDGRGKGVRNRERQGHGVYQPRGGWTRPEGRDGRGGKPSRGGRDFYDRPRRNDFDRDDRGHREEHDYEQKDKPSDKEGGLSSEEIRKDGGISDDDKSKKGNESGSGEPNKKTSKSPVSSKRNIRGGSRLHGYGPPSDKPFSSGNTTKEEEIRADKPNDPNNKSNLPPSSGPVPLMELGDISPPNMPAGRSRHHGAGRGGGRGMQPRVPERQEPYPYRGGSKRGRGGDAKPLMSINSNELDKNEGESESESQDDETKKSLKKKESNKGNPEKSRQNQNELRNPPRDKTSVSPQGSEPSNHPNNQDSSNNNKFKSSVVKSGNSTSELDTYAVGNANEATAVGNTFDNSENVDSESYQKKNSAAKDKTAFNNKNVRNDKQQPQPQSHVANKDRRVKHPPYDPPHPRSSMPPRFQKNSGSNQGQFSNSKGSDNNTAIKDSNESSNTWEKIAGTTKIDHTIQPQSQPVSQTMDNKDSSVSADLKIVGSSVIQPVNPSAAVMDGSGGPLKTMIFENRNFKSVSKPAGSGKGNDPKDPNLTSLELPKDMNLGFGKSACDDSRDIDFVSNYDDQVTSQASITSHLGSKPMPIGQSRTFQTHQPSPISPLAKDLTEKIQSVKRVWENAPSMPSVAEQSGVCGSEDNTFHGGFVNDSFKADSSRDFSSTLSQPQSGYAPGSSPALAAISKPDSSTSPNSSNLRQVKPQQQATMESQSHGMSSSPFTYSMPQQHQGNAFGGPPAIPSPPAVMYGTHSGGPHTGVYQAFPHVDSSQVMNNSARTQYGQYSNPQGAGGGYGLNTSIFMTSMDAAYQPISSYQHSHQQQHSQSGQAPNSSNRISPGPMPSSGGNAAGVIMNPNNKSQGAAGTHPNMSHQHQVIGTHNQQAYSQLSHHHSGAMPHHQLPVGHVPAKATGYAQTGLTSQSQLFIPYDPQQQQVINMGQNYMSSGMRNAPGGPPPATPPVQGLQSSTYYSGNAGNQVYHTGSNQGGTLQQLHVAVAPNPQALQNLQTATQQYGLQFQSPLNMQGYNQQAASTVSALNLGGQLIRPGPTGHSHYNMKQPGMDMVQQSHSLKSHESILNPTWTGQGFSLNPGFHGGNKAGGSSDRNAGSNIGNQRKGSHPMGNMQNMGGIKYMPGTGYPSTQQGGRFTTPGPIQRPVSASPSAGPPGSVVSFPNSPHSGPLPLRSVGGIKPKNLIDNLSKHSTQSNSGIEEGLLDKFMAEGHRSISITPVASKVVMCGSRLVDDSGSDHNGGDNSAMKNPPLTISPTNTSPITPSEM